MLADFGLTSRITRVFSSASRSARAFLETAEQVRQVAAQLAQFRGLLLYRVLVAARDILRATLTASRAEVLRANDVEDGAVVVAEHCTLLVVDCGVSVLEILSG
jgi:hypothetical protein